MHAWRGRRLRDDRGASAVEYALLIALVAAVVLTGVIALGQALPTLYELEPW